MTASFLQQSGPLSNVPLFEGLTNDQLNMVYSLLRNRVVPAGTTLMAVEQPGKIAYIIVTGTVKVHVEQADGSDVILAILGPGEVVGEMSVSDSLDRSANVVTLEQTTLLWVDRTTFRDWLLAVPVMTYNLVRVLSRRLRLANIQIESLATLDVYGRVARQILAFAHEYGQKAPDGSILIPIRLTQSDLADLVGASRVRVNQVIVFYKEQGYVSVGHNSRITVHNPDALIARYT